MKNNNKKTIMIVIIAIIILVVLIFVGLKIFKNKEVDETQNDLDQDIVAQDIDEDGSEEEVNTGTSNSTQDGTVVDSVDTVVVNKFVDENGNDMTEDAIQEAKNKIIEAVKQVPVETLGLDISLDNARFIFTESITTINHNECFVFSIYVQEGENLVNKGMYAISRDTKILYKFNTKTVSYELIQG